MKKLIVLATLAALPAAAMADVTISGNLALGIVNTKEKGSGSVTTENRTSGEIKFAGSDDLGNGLKAIWQIASRIDLADSKNVDTQNVTDDEGEVADSDGNPFTAAKSSSAAFKNAWATRDSFVGLEGGFGRLTLGNIYLMPTSGAMAIFENRSATAESSLYDQGDRYNNTVSYKSPSFAGFTATVQHSFGANAANENAKLYVTAGSLAYEGDGFSVSYDTMHTKEDASSNTAKLHELNASVSLNDLTLQAGYARGTSQADDIKRSGWGVAASYALGAFTPKIGYWHEGDSKEAGVKANDGFKAVAVGVEYALSKRTRAGFEWTNTNFDDANDADVRTATVYLGTKF